MAECLLAGLVRTGKTDEGFIGSDTKAEWVHYVKGALWEGREGMKGNGCFSPLFSKGLSHLDKIAGKGEKIRMVEDSKKGMVRCMPCSILFFQVKYVN